MRDSLRAAPSKEKAISCMLANGKWTCSSKSFARPSQNRGWCSETLISDCVLRAPIAPPMPTASFRPSVQPFLGSWQVAQLTRPSAESLGSNSRSLPNAAASARRGSSDAAAGADEDGVSADSAGGSTGQARTVSTPPKTPSRLRPSAENAYARACFGGRKTRSRRPEPASRR